MKRRKEGYYLKNIEPSKWQMDSWPWRPKPSEDLAYFLGVMKGDGSSALFKRRDGTWNAHVHLGVTEQAFGKSFAQSLKAVGIKNIHAYTYPPGNDKHQPMHYVFAYCTPLVLWYRNLEFNKLNIELDKEEYIRAFIRGFYESEGSLIRLGNYPFIDMTNTNKELSELVYKLLLKLGFNPTLRRYHYLPRRPLFHIRLNRGLEIIDFLKRIKPCIKNSWKQIKLPRQNRWTNEGLQILRDNYAFSTRSKLLALLPSRTAKATRIKASRLRLRREVRH